MKHLKMLGLAAIVATGLAAFAGAGTASATTLFTSSTPAGPYSKGTTIHLSLVDKHFVSFTDKTGNTVSKCTESTFSGSTSNETGTTVPVSVSTTTIGGCTIATADVVLATGTLEFETTASNTATVVAKSFEITFETSVTCSYGFGTGTILGSITGGLEPVLSIANATMIKTAGGFLCASTTKMDADYIITLPHAVYFGA